MRTRKSINDLSYKIVGCALRVHTILGPGLFESIYHEAFLYELRKNGLDAQSQVPVLVEYDGQILKDPLRIDILVCDEVIVELKAQELILPIHKAQLLTYLKLTGKCKGLLINFCVESLKFGITPFVTEAFKHLPEE